MPETATEFPADWNQWRYDWTRWEADRIEDGSLVPTKNPFPGKNILADEILGCWLIGGAIVELSVIHRFLGNERCVGITIDRQDGSGRSGDLGVVHSFAQLEEALGIARG